MRYNYELLNIRQKYPPSVSLCMIMQNEEAVIGRCLRLAKPIVDEIIIIDTGSTDGSMEIARAMGARVYSVPWGDDFAGPRNTSISLATCYWILVLDPDEYISPKDYPLFRELLTRYSIPAYILTTRNYTNNMLMMKFRRNDKAYPETAHFKGYSPSIKTRLFQRHLKFKFSGCWHELLDHDVIRRGMVSFHPPLPIHHHCNGRPNRTRAQRSALYLRLGRKKVTEEPKNGQAWNEYGVALSIAKRFDEAINAYQNAIRLGYRDQHNYNTLSLFALRKGLPIHHQFFRDKAICCRYPQLTHYRPELKELLPPGFVI